MRVLCPGVGQFPFILCTTNSICLKLGVHRLALRCQHQKDNSCSQLLFTSLLIFPLWLISLTGPGQTRLNGSSLLGRNNQTLMSTESKTNLLKATHPMNQRQVKVTGQVGTSQRNQVYVSQRGHIAYTARHCESTIVCKRLCLQCPIAAKSCREHRQSPLLPNSKSAISYCSVWRSIRFCNALLFLIFLSLSVRYHKLSNQPQRHRTILSRLTSSVSLVSTQYIHLEANWVDLPRASTDLYVSLTQASATSERTSNGAISQPNRGYGFHPVFSEEL